MTNVMKVTPVKASARLQSLGDTPMYVKALIYGEPGAGKTYLACTAKNPLLILSEWAVARPTLAQLQKERRIDPDTIFVQSWADFEEAYKYAKANADKYDTIIVDSITDLNDRAIEEVLKESVANSVSRQKTHDPDQLEIGDWGKVANKTLYAVRLFRDLPCDVIMLALAQEVKGEMFTAPMASPKAVQKKLAANFNMVGYLMAEQQPGKTSVRKLHVDMTHLYQAKNPGGALGATITNPDMAVIINQIKEHLHYVKDNTVPITANIGYIKPYVWPDAAKDSAAINVVTDAATQAEPTPTTPKAAMRPAIRNLT